MLPHTLMNTLTPFIHLSPPSMPQTSLPPSRIHRFEPSELSSLSLSLSIPPFARVHCHPTSPVKLVPFPVSNESMLQVSLELTFIHFLSFDVVFGHRGIVKFPDHAVQTIHLVHTHLSHLSIRQLIALSILIHVQIVVFAHADQLATRIHFLKETLHPFHWLVEEITTRHITTPGAFVNDLAECTVHDHPLVLKLAKYALDPSIFVYALSLYCAILIVVAVTVLVGELLVVLSCAHQLSTFYNPLVIVPFSVFCLHHLRIPLTISVVSNPNNLALLITLSEQSRFQAVYQITSHLCHAILIHSLHRTHQLVIQIMQFQVKRSVV